MTTEKKNTVFTVTLGCPKNQVDAEGMTHMLRASGYDMAESADEADFLVLNTCGFIASARAESVETALGLASQKREGQHLIVAGCLTEREGEKLRDDVPQASGF